MEAQMQAAFEAVHEAVERLLRDGEHDPHHLVLALARATGELAPTSPRPAGWRPRNSWTIWPNSSALPGRSLRRRGARDPDGNCSAGTCARCTLGAAASRRRRSRGRPEVATPSQAQPRGPADQGEHDRPRPVSPPAGRRGYRCEHRHVGAGRSRRARSPTRSPAGGRWRRSRPQALMPRMVRVAELRMRTARGVTPSCRAAAVIVSHSPASWAPYPDRPVGRSPGPSWQACRPQREVAPWTWRRFLARCGPSTTRDDEDFLRMRC